MKRAILIVMDGCGAGEAPDAAFFGDTDHPATVKHVWEAAGGLDLPNLGSCGFLDACGIDAVPLSMRGGCSPVLSATERSDRTEADSCLDLNLRTRTPFPSDSSTALGMTDRDSDVALLCLSRRYGRARELSMGKAESSPGKDSVTGHWEMVGVITPKAFPTYPNGFPIPLVKEFEKRIGTQTLGNKPASGTEIIKELGALHVETT